MEPTEIIKMVRKHLDNAAGLSTDQGFEIIDIGRFDGQWSGRCRVFSTILSMMVKYMVIVSDGHVTCVRRL